MTARKIAKQVTTSKKIGDGARAGSLGQVIDGMVADSKVVLAGDGATYEERHLRSACKSAAKKIRDSGWKVPPSWTLELEVDRVDTDRISAHAEREPENAAEPPKPGRLARPDEQ
jgi:hypothetical protein